MITFCAARTTLLAAVLLLAAGCSREQQDWRSAEGADTSEAFAHFLEQHPDSELANQARLRIAQLGEESDWRRTDGIATIEAYRQFLAQHPNGKWAEEARIRIEGFSLGSAPRTAQAPANVGAKRTRRQRAAARHGRGRTAAPAPAAVPAPAGAAGPSAQRGRGGRSAAGRPAPPAEEPASRRLQRQPRVMACSSERSAARRVPIGSGNGCRGASDPSSGASPRASSSPVPAMAGSSIGCRPRRAGRRRRGPCAMR